MKFSFTSLGTASALPTVNRYPSAHVLNVHERLFLIDCGEGCQMQLRRYGFSFHKIQNIFISHVHGDHIFGIYGLLSTMSLMGRTADIFIYAPEEFGEILASFLRHFGEGFKFETIHKILKSKDKELILETRTIEVSSFPLNHRVDCYGFLFAEKSPKRNIHKYMLDKYQLSLAEIAILKDGKDIVREDGEVLSNNEITYIPYTPRTFAYCSDTAPFKKLKEYINEVDLVFHEATFMEDMSSMAKTTLHSTAKQAAKTAMSANVKKMVIGHFSSRYKNLNLLLEEARSIFKNTSVAEEGKEYEL